MTNVQIIGEEQLNICLKNLPETVRKSLTISAIRKAAMPIKRRAVELAPARRGGKQTTKKAITIVANRKVEGPEVWVGPTAGKRVTYDAWYSRFHEFGTRGFGKRKIRIKGVGVNLKTGNTWLKKAGTGVYTKGGTGLPAIGFMKRAYEEKIDEARNNIKKEIAIKTTAYLRRTAPKIYAY